jgi:hypothetical protein
MEVTYTTHVKNFIVQGPSIYPNEWCSTWVGSDIIRKFKIERSTA